MKDTWSDRLRPKRASDLTLRKLSFRISCAQHDNKVLYRELNTLALRVDNAHAQLCKSTRTLYTILYAQCIIGFLYGAYHAIPAYVITDAYHIASSCTRDALILLETKWNDFT